jgi:DNA polymerase III subunit beta
VKITVLQDKLAAALSIVGRAVANRSTLPVLGNILLEAKGDTLRLAATNLNIGANVTISATVEEAGAITLPARLLAEFVNSLPTAQRVTIDVMSRTMTARLKCSGYDANIKGIDADEFPIVAQMVALTGEAITLPATALKTMIDRVAFAAATDESRPTLTGVEVVMSDNRLTMAATDGYRLSVQSADVDYAGERKTIIPAKSLAEVARVIDGDTVQVLVIGESQIAFGIDSSLGRIEIVSSLIDAKFPDYKAIIPKRAETAATFKRTDLLSAVRVAALFAKDNSNIIRLSLNGDLTVSATSTESGDGSSVVRADITGPELEIAFNAAYVSAVLSSVSDDSIRLELTQPNRPGKLLTSDENYLHVIMPMHPPKG